MDKRPHPLLRIRQYICLTLGEVLIPVTCGSKMYRKIDSDFITKANSVIGLKYSIKLARIETEFSHFSGFFLSVVCYFYVFNENLSVFRLMHVQLDMSQTPR